VSVLVPRSLEEIPEDAEFVAGGTDLGERVRNGSGPGTLADIGRLPGLRSIDVSDAGLSIGALATVEEVGAHAGIIERYPALAAVCSTLATPQIRTRATMGGVLCQRTRCWYFRHPAFSCFKDGGTGCPARGGDNLYGVAFDLGPCVYPHPSSVALALLAYDGVVETNRQEVVTMDALFGDGSDPSRDHHLGRGELLTRVRVADSGGAHPSAYVRLMSRAWAEWPLVECVVRLGVERGEVALARVAVGGVASIPLRLPAVEGTLVGTAFDERSCAEAARVAADGASVLPGAQDKREMIRRTVLEALDQARSARS